MSEHQVRVRSLELLALCWMLFILRPVSSQCPQHFLLVNSLCVQPARQCNAPFLLQNGVCVAPNTPTCPTGQVYINDACYSIVSGLSSPAAPPAQAFVVQPCPLLPTPTQPTTPAPYQPPIIIMPTSPSTTSPPPTLPPPTLPPPTLPPPTSPPPTSPPTPPPTTPAAPPPAPLIRCPAGTVLINDKCRLVYCGTGIFSGGQCVNPNCPPGTYWKNYRCEPNQHVELPPIHLEKTIKVEQPKQASPLVINNVNNWVVNTSIALTQPEPEYVDYEDNVPAPQATPPPLPPPTSPKRSCCHVVAPRVCRHPSQSPRWQCYNPSQRQCGDFCQAPKMILKPPAIRNWQIEDDEMMIMPPNYQVDSCRARGDCPQAANRYDCSGCASGVAERCSSYCYNYRCSTHSCAYYDQQQYCIQYPGQIGCRSEDGWSY
ncbi:proline-rich extensin-like protein EPR1 [Scaptodrosophila lebanonensis]|uniref:Proline-rich extensin-like protein EPR1 n=1 Tax=Drosophila lebanonensis TaxID=7225 RepID=A0A6J2TC47_DROLE|nr:proline-rich extensin-like protein EPR1 [Scaptodrosophila lebanonensis]